MNKRKILILVILGIIIGLTVKFNRSIIIKDKNTYTEYKGFNIYCNSNIIIDNHIANIGVKNKDTNIDSCYIQLVLENDIIYESEILEPGTALEKVYINKDINLKEGLYGGEIIFNILDENKDKKCIYKLDINIDVEGGVMSQ